MSFGIYGALGTWGGAPPGGDVTMTVETGSFETTGGDITLSVGLNIQISGYHFLTTGYPIDLVVTKGPGPDFSDVEVGYAEDGFSVTYALDEITVNYE